MVIKESKLKGVFVIELKPIGDHRGKFIRTYDQKIFEEYGLNTTWVQENQSITLKKQTIRGLHFQFPPFNEIKTVRVGRGKFFMVVVDLRKGSKSLGMWDSFILSTTNNKMLYVPQGLALGACTLQNNGMLLYKMGAYFNPESQSGIKWNDPTLNIPWPIKSDPITSEKDNNAMSFKDFIKKYHGLEV